jgi:hypothetical protein
MKYSFPDTKFVRIKRSGNDTLLKLLMTLNRQFDGKYSITLKVHMSIHQFQIIFKKTQI